MLGLRYTLAYPFHLLCYDIAWISYILQFQRWIRFRCLFSDLPNFDHKDTNYFPMISINNWKSYHHKPCELIFPWFFDENVQLLPQKERYGYTGTDWSIEDWRERLWISRGCRVGLPCAFCSPFTGGDKCMVSKGTAFATHSPMRGDALYMHLIGENDELYKRMEELVKTNYEQLFTRLQGFLFFITEERLKTLPLKFRSGSAEWLLDVMRQLRSPLYPVFP